MEKENGMTEAQEQAIEKIVHLMREHFNAGVLIVEAREVGDGKEDARQFLWHGGISTALGLNRMLDAKLCKKSVEIEDEAD